MDLPLNLLAQRDLDQAWGHVRYVAETGHIWLTTRTGGFWVLELEPQVRAALDLDPKPAQWPDGAAPRPPDTRRMTARSPLDVTRSPAAYCTIGKL